MAFDGVILHKVKNEIGKALSSHIDKIYQPSKDELVFLLRKKGFAKRLLVNIRGSEARVQFTEARPENPETPPMFCMLLRKHFLGARLTDVTQIGLDRILILHFEASNEMGDRVSLKIALEFIGGSSNAVLIGADGRILDAVKRSDIEKSFRLIQPGAVYRLPESGGKLNILEEGIDEILKAVEKKGEIPLSRAVLESIDGISPLVAREIAFRVMGEDGIYSPEAKEKLKAELLKIRQEIETEGPYTVLLDGEKGAKDFSYTDISQYGSFYTKKTFDNLTNALDFYYNTSSKKANNQLKAVLLQRVNILLSRLRRRVEQRRIDLKKSADKEQFRIYGELLKANLYAIKTGDSLCKVQNFYDENLSEIEIPLNVALSPQANAQRYFKEYKKAQTARQMLGTLIEKDLEEVKYIESVLDALERSETPSEAAEIRDELVLGGYIFKKTANKKPKKESFSLKEFTSPSGKRVIVGKNNRQNDYITTRLSEKNDLWFHTKDIAGSHVLLKASENEATSEDIIFCALLAAENSKAATSSNVAVDYTPVKYVKKPNGAKAGMVIYTINKTVFVTPERKL